MRLKAQLIWLLLGLLGLAACGPDAAPVKGVSTDIKITYQRQGGVTGITQEWEIYPDGRIVGSGGQELQVPPQQVISLLAEAAQLQSSSLQDTYVSDDACCDQFIYTVIVQVGDQETMIQTSDTAEQPEQLTSLLTGIEDLISNAEPIK